jgi:hypothetical protein
MSIQARRISEAPPRSEGERTVRDRLDDALRRAREQAKDAERRRLGSRDETASSIDSPFP